MIQAGTVSFRDRSAADAALAIVRYDAEQVALCLSLKSGGDLEVVMSKEDAKRLLAALHLAVGS